MSFLIGKKKRERGAAAIEFAIVSMVFFMVFYAIVGYAMPLLMLLTFNELSAEATRRAVRVEPGEGFEQRVATQVTNALNESWLPADWRGPCDGYNGQFYKLSVDNGRPMLEVCIQYDYATNPIIPIIHLGGISIPSVPDVLKGKTSIQL